MKQLLLLYNENAGRGRIADNLEAIVAVFEQGGYAVRTKAIRFDANPLEGEEELSLVVVCGGDGTINYLLNSMRALSLDIPIGVIPVGTANDFAGALGLSNNPLEAAQQIVTGSVERVDCGCVNGLYFINVLSFGLFTTTSQHTPDSLKHRFGKLAYLAVGARDLRNFHTIPLEIVCDGKQLQTDCLLGLVFNGETAGRFKFARQASVRDGLLDLIIINRNNFVKAVCGVLTYFITGQENYAVQHLTASHIELRSALSPETDVDGQAGATFPLVVDCLPGAVAIVTPRKG